VSTTLPHIEFESTFEDIVAFNKYHFARFTKKNVAALKVIEVPLVLLLSAVGAFLIWRSWALTGLTVVVAFFTRRLADPYIQGGLEQWFQKRGDLMREKLLRRMLSEAPNDAVLGRQRLSLTADGLYQQSSTGSLSVHYCVVGHIAETADHVFIYTSALKAIVVPISNQASDIHALAQFLVELRSRLPPSR